IFEDDCLSRWQFETYAQAYESVAEFMVFYNERRMHSSILDLSYTNTPIVIISFSITISI
ncbi:hypothetical protein MXL46_14735, partial [Heyndrickxia sporothermodurans]|uniref:hypothetical protein n=1 Tax=Heyndrickxia sporothermodurans TaxID=46224 RepID=UPI002DB75C09